jgi:Na+-transporting NADH:ubiquinone oxidoreductase subunit C
VQYSVQYIVGFAAAVCVVCALAVSVSAVSLKDLQLANKRLDRQKNVLSVSGLVESTDGLTAQQVEQYFADSIRARIIDLETGEYDDSIDPATFDQQKAAKDPATSEPAPPNPSKIMRLPDHALVYEVMDGDQVSRIILPIQGMGLWSTLYGYIALSGDDSNTVEGITYYDQAETAGLGGEVENPRWKAHWPGRKVFNSSWQPVIKVKKGEAGPPSEDPYQVDGLSGATLTSNGVTNMLRFWMGEEGFGPYLAHYRAARGI